MELLLLIIIVFRSSVEDAVSDNAGSDDAVSDDVGSDIALNVDDWSAMLATVDEDGVFVVVGFAAIDDLCMVSEVASIFPVDAIVA